MWSLNCLTIWITHSNPCCLSNHSFPNYSVAIHKQAPKIISRIRNLLHSSVNDKTQKNQRSPTHNNRLPSAGICAEYSAQYPAIFSTIFCAQYSTGICAQYSAPSFIISSSPVCSLPSCSNQQWQLHLFHHAVTRIKPAWMRKSEKKPLRRFLLLMWVMITLLLLFCCCHRKKQLPHLPCGELTAAAA